MHCNTLRFYCKRKSMISTTTRSAVQVFFHLTSLITEVQGITQGIGVKWSQLFRRKYELVKKMSAAIYLIFKRLISWLLI